MKIKLYTTLYLLVLSTILAEAQVDTLWTKTFGGISTDEGSSVQQTTDGGYIITGWTESFGTGDSDVWLIKTNSSGDTTWIKTFGGVGYDEGNWVEQTTDGGYVISGNIGTYGSSDVWLIKMNSSGDTLWTRTFGDINHNWSNSVQQTNDGGYILVGGTESYGSRDIWLLNTDTFGDTLWTKIIGGPDSDAGYSVRQTTDGGYIIAGLTTSFGAGDWNFWLIKTNELGDTLWSRIYGGIGNEHFSSVEQTMDGGYILAGYTNSFGAGSVDVWLIKTNGLGDTLWTKTFGGWAPDLCYSSWQTTDGGYILAGNTYSFGAGGGDVWLIKTTPDVSDKEPNIDLILSDFSLQQNYPNPFNPDTKINWQLPVGSWQTLKVFDVLGNKVATLVDEYKPAGSYEVEWNASNYPSGVYFYQLRTNEFVETKKMILLK